MNIITKEESILLGLKYYFTGIPCQNDHIDKRYVNTGICYQCKRDRNKTCNTNNPETAKALTKRQYIKHRDKFLAHSYKWAENNPDKVREIKKRNKKKHKDKYRKAENERNKRKRRENHVYRFNRNISKNIWEFLKGYKNRRSWESFVDYKYEELIPIIESKFNENMSWSNYGSYWELDHIIPLNYFYSLDISPEEKVRQAWSLSNLQPLECSLNRSKLDNLNFDYDKKRKEFFK